MIQHKYVVDVFIISSKREEERDAPADTQKVCRNSSPVLL